MRDELERPGAAGPGDAPVIRAAGCVVWRPVDAEGGSAPGVGGGPVEVLVAHRPRYDDWSLAKGKLEPGEDDRAAAEREVEEETGFTGELGPELTSTHYVDHRGRPKVVRYWALRSTGGRFEPNDEVDAVRWVDPDEAARLLTYDHDRLVVASFLATRS